MAKPVSRDDELARRLEFIEQHVDDIAAMVDGLRSSISALLGEPQPTPLPELLEIRSRQRVLVVGNSTAGAADELRAAADDVEVHEIAKAAPLAALLERAPYDAILIAEPVRSVAWDWIRHTRAGGLIACVYDPSGVAGQPVLLRQRGTEAAGSFLVTAPEPLTPRVPDLMGLHVKPFEASQAARHGRTTLPLCPWDVPLPWYLATCAMSDGLVLSRTPDGGVLLETGDGSRCHLTSHGRYRHVVEDGPADLFDHVVQAHQHWQNGGRLGWNRLHLTVAGDAHNVSIGGHPHNRMLSD